MWIWKRPWVDPTVCGELAEVKDLSANAGRRSCLFSFADMTELREEFPPLEEGGAPLLFPPRCSVPFSLISGFLLDSAPTLAWHAGSECRFLHLFLGYPLCLSPRPHVSASFLYGNSSGYQGWAPRKV